MHLGRCQVPEVGPIVSVVEISNAWCPLEGHTYLSKPDGASLFRCLWPFDRHYALIGHWCMWFPLKYHAYLNKTAAISFV